MAIIMMNVLCYGALTGTLGTAIGCVFGAVLLWIWKKANIRKSLMNRNTAYSVLFEFSSGLMMAIVTFHLLPEAMGMGGVFYAVLGLLTGLVFLWFFGTILNRSCEGSQTGLFLFLGILIHNIPEGMAVGASLVSHFSLAMSLLTVITVHDIPEGVSAYLSSQTEGRNRIFITGMLILCGVCTAVAAWFGYFAGELSQTFHAGLLGFAAGSMLYILVFELSREANRLSGRKISDIAYIFGLVLGILLK